MSNLDKIPIRDVARALGMEIVSRVGREYVVCPLCAGRQKSMVLGSERNVAVCSACQQGLSPVALVEHVRGCDEGAAAAWLRETLHRQASAPTEPAAAPSTEHPPDTPSDDGQRPPSATAPGPDPASNPPLLEAALSYAARGWSVFPLHSVSSGRCTCGRPDCQSAGKHPRTRRGLKDASSDPTVIRQWWAQNPDSNIGLPTGPKSALVVVDVDAGRGGLETLRRLEEEHGPIADTVRVETGGGGLHIYLAYPDGHTIRNSAGRVGEGIDIRAAGGYVVAPPSVHASGKPYAWRPECSPEDVKPAPVPDWLLSLLAQEAPPTVRGAERSGFATLLAEGVAEGKRNDTASRLAGRLFAKGLSVDEVSVILRDWNRRNRPPLDDEELGRVITSVAQRELGKRGGKRATGLPMAYQPFPTDTLPEPLRSYVREGAAAIGCDESMIALPLLGAAGGAVGTGRAVMLKRDWIEYPILWTAVIAPSGEHKSPALDMALRAVRKLQDAAFEVHACDMEVYDQELAEYEAAQKGRRGRGPSPPKPKKPVCVRYIISDITVESLAVRLHEAPRGLLLARDELGAFLGSFDQYRRGKGRDAALWCEAHRAGPWTIDRKSSETETLHIPRVAVSLTGGLQPGMLPRLLGAEHFEDGLVPRFLFALPPSRLSPWTERQVGEATAARVERLFADLVRLVPVSNPEEGLAPGILPLSPEAHMLWVSFFNEWRKAIHEEPDERVRAGLSKLEAYCARLALLFELVHAPKSNEVGRPAIEGAVGLVQWFRHEMLRVYGLYDESPEEATRRNLIEWIGRRGGRATPRMLMDHNRRDYPTAGEALAALADLAAAGVGVLTWVSPPKGGHNYREFRLKASEACEANTPRTCSQDGAKNGASVCDTQVKQPPDKDPPAPGEGGGSHEHDAM